MKLVKKQEELIFGTYKCRVNQKALKHYNEIF